MTERIRRCNLGRLGYTPGPFIDNDHFPYWLEYARLIGDELGLTHVKVTLYHTPTAGDVNAQSQHHPDYNHFALWLGGDWEYSTPEDQREDIVHEWMHYVVGYVTHPFRILEMAVGRLMWQPTKLLGDDAEEQMVDILGRYLSVHLPLPSPPWGTEPKSYEGSGYRDLSPPETDACADHPGSMTVDALPTD